MKIARTLVHGRVRFRVNNQTAGRRVRRFFPSRQAARAYVREREEEQKALGTNFAALTPGNRLKIALCLEKLDRAGATLDEAVDFFLANRRTAPAPPLGQVLAEFLQAKELAGRRRRYLQSLKSSLGKFIVGREEQTADAVDAAQIQAWLGGNGWRPATRRGYLIDLRTFFKFAGTRHYCAENPANAVELPLLEDFPPGILTVPECEILLRTCRKIEPGILPVLAVGLFAGLRPAEAEQLTWAEVGKDLIEIKSEKSKTRRRRLVTVSKNLTAWLRLGGDLPAGNFRRRFARVRQAAGLLAGWPHDALRHSFASYHLALHQSPDKTAHELGHSSTQMLYAHYRELVTPAAAKKVLGAHAGASS